MAFMDFVKKHVSGIIVITLSVAALAVAGIVIGSDYAKYKEYEKKYDAEAAELANKFAKLPEKVFVDDDYIEYNEEKDEIVGSKSNYENYVILNARDGVVAPLSTSTAQTYVKLDDSNLGEAISGLNRKGGAISFTVIADKHGKADIEIAMMNNWFDSKNEFYELDNITDFIKIQINKLNVQTEDISLSTDRENFTSLILQNTNLVEGENELTITTSAYNDKDNKDNYLYVMPDIRNVTFLCESIITTPVVEE